MRVSERELKTCRRGCAVITDVPINFFLILLALEPDNPAFFFAMITTIMMIIM